MNRREVVKIAAIFLGGSLSNSISSAVIANAGSNANAAIAANAFFDTDASNMVAILSELIIPETDTPGAIEAAVPAFIELIVSDWYTEKERDIFLEGLTALEKYCKKTSGKGFSQCASEEQIAALKWAEKESKSFRSKARPGDNTLSETAPFFLKLKELTVLGYYTSEVGAKQELIYNPMPMKYEGDLNFVDVGRQWSY
jgi:hypothetical protein